MKRTDDSRQWTEQEMENYYRRCQNVNATFENGDKADGRVQYDEGYMWFGAVDKNGQEYETKELPYERLDCTNLTFITGTPEGIMAQMFPNGDDLPLFTGQPVERKAYDARGYQPKEYHRQLDIFKENQA